MERAPGARPASAWTCRGPAKMVRRGPRHLGDGSSPDCWDGTGWRGAPVPGPDAAVGHLHVSPSRWCCWGVTLAPADLPGHPAAVPASPISPGRAAVGRRPGAAGRRLLPHRRVRVGGAVLVGPAPAVRGPAGHPGHGGRETAGSSGPCSARRLTSAQVEKLTESRGAAVDTAASDLRRIERDLHDGAQARLVALAMDLGLAKEKMSSDPEAATRMVSEAQRRGQARPAGAARPGPRHPPGGAHRPRSGRGAVRRGGTLHGGRSRSSVDLPRRPPPPVESVAYFLRQRAAAERLQAQPGDGGHGEPCGRWAEPDVSLVIAEQRGGAAAVRTPGTAPACPAWSRRGPRRGRHAPGGQPRGRGRRP